MSSSKRSPWRAVGDTSTPYPSWLRELADVSGVYAIRSGGRVLYVGESHKGRLKKTITRHFQAWSRGKSWWSGLFGSGADPGRVYERARCEVCFRVCAANLAIAIQDDWIRSMKPRDNVLGAPSDDDVPF